MWVKWFVWVEWLEMTHPILFCNGRDACFCYCVIPLLWRILKFFVVRIITVFPRSKSLELTNSFFLWFRSLCALRQYSILLDDSRNGIFLVVLIWFSLCCRRNLSPAGNICEAAPNALFCTRSWVRATIGSSTANSQSGWREIRNALPVINWDRWGFRRCY